MSEFRPFTAPYSIYLAPSGTAKFSPAEIGDTPGDPWVKLEDGQIAQADVKFLFEREVEEEDPSQNDSWSTDAYVTKRGFGLSFSMKKPGVRTLARLLDDAQVTTVAKTASIHASEEFEFGEGDLKFWAVTVLGSGIVSVNGAKLPRVGYIAHCYYQGNVELDTNRTKPAMVECMFRGLKHPTTGRTFSIKRITEAKGN